MLNNCAFVVPDTGYRNKRSGYVSTPVIPVPDRWKVSSIASWPKVIIQFIWKFLPMVKSYYLLTIIPPFGIA